MPVPDQARGLLFMLLTTVVLTTTHRMVRYPGDNLHPFIIVFYRNLFGLIAIPAR